jgi:hypothetical protein
MLLEVGHYNGQPVEQGSGIPQKVLERTIERYQANVEVAGRIPLTSIPVLDLCRQGKMAEALRLFHSYSDRSAGQIFPNSKIGRDVAAIGLTGMRIVLGAGVVVSPRGVGVVEELYTRYPLLDEGPSSSGDTTGGYGDIGSSSSYGGNAPPSSMAPRGPRVSSGSVSPRRQGEKVGDSSQGDKISKPREKTLGGKPVQNIVKTDGRTGRTTVHNPKHHDVNTGVDGSGKTTRELRQKPDSSGNSGNSGNGGQQKGSSGRGGRTNK